MDNMEWFDTLSKNEKRDFLDEFTHEVDDLYFYDTIDGLLEESCVSPKEAFELAYQNPEANPEYYGEKPVGFVFESDDTITPLFDFDDYIEMVKEAYAEDFDTYLGRMREELGEVDDE